VGIRRGLWENPAKEFGLMKSGYSFNEMREAKHRVLVVVSVASTLYSMLFENKLD
jgi:hypothetical protein